MLTLDQEIGNQITDAREEVRMSQSELGKRVGDYLGRAWPRQTVSQVERGERPLKAVEIVAICQILPVAPFTLLMPSAPVKLPSGRQLDQWSAMKAGLSDEQTHEFVEYIKGAVTEGQLRMRRFIEVVDDQWESVTDGLGKVINAVAEIDRAKLDVLIGEEVD